MPVNSTLHRLALVAAVVAFAVIVLGAYVRLSHAGLGCPDWPGCYGQLTWPVEAHEVT
ncbi:MAG: COX15/CtaA family protein, partial [Xanthomonadales bacterium]|nr:COX15/CtaA family protein [Xanthomonadales bacterium]